MTKRKFYKTTVTFVVLHEGSPTEISDMELGTIEAAVTDGSCCFAERSDQVAILNGCEAADALEEAGYDPSCFRLTADGDDEDAEGTLSCKTCGEDVLPDEQAEYLAMHHPGANAFSAEQVRDCFEAHS